ncbi:uncharacterized protein LOC143860420 [Tasmannia lanceolata]|uniref:uncharacterized protein LOC143860420 n=1 Tax=Tasmannia lanceolata TaxID=3420 RepID=UPI004063690D
MATAQFAMVEELASLIKDNLSCKHIVLSIEEALVNFLQNDTSSDGVLELEPMSPYHRLLLHRLADIYGFAHESVGEGSDRHLILERCPDSSIPSVLVSDILWQYDGYHSEMTSHQLLKRKDASPALKIKQSSFPPSTPLEEREAAYLAARERIFSLDEGEIKVSLAPKQRNIPVVARRMIAHALGQRIGSNLVNENLTSPNNKVCEGPKDILCSPEKNEVHSSVKPAEQSTHLSSQNSSTQERKMYNKQSGKVSRSSVLQSEKKAHSKATGDSSTSGGVNSRVGGKDSLNREHFGAAKRMFAHALGLPSAKENPSLLLKCNETSKTHNQQVGADRLRT